jgi:hypothetical protein
MENPYFCKRFEVDHPHQSTCHGPNFESTLNHVIGPVDLAIRQSLERDMKKVCVKPYLFASKVPIMHTEFGLAYQEWNEIIFKKWIRFYPIKALWHAI